jgi:hypothetical protein
MALTKITSNVIANNAVTQSKIDSSVELGGGGIKISNIQVTNSGGTVLDDTAVDTAGGYIVLTGSGFASGCQVLINNVLATSTTFVNSTTVRAQLPATAAGTYIVYLANTDGSVGIRVNGVTFSANPSWQTSSSLSGNVDDAISIQLSATEATVFALQSGSTLPAGLTLSSGGLISGAVTGLSEETVYSFTVIASDAENQDSPRTFSITITVGDQYFNRTVLAINADVGNTFASDASTNNFAITVAGDTRPSNFSPYNTNWSNYFDGTGDYLNQSTNRFLDGSTWTVEGWVYTSDTTATIAAQYVASGGQFSSRTILGISSGLIYIFQAGSSVSGTTNISNNQWYHIAYVRNGSTVKAYVNGILEATFSGFINPSLTTTTFFYDGFNSGQELLGYFSNLRVTTTEVYASNFTPPTSPLTAITGTALLTCQSNRLIDNSTNNFTITKNGDVKISAFGPFTETDTTTGSGYFGSTSDNLRVATITALGSGDFTIECWIYPISFANYRVIWDNRTSDPDASGIAFGLDANAKVYVYTNNGFAITTTTALISNHWTHVSLVRNGAGSGNLKIYINGQSDVTTATITANISRTSVYIGNDLDGTGAPFVGYISNLRTAASAVYTAAFTPPTAPLTAVSGTQLLTLQNRQPVNNHSFIDASRNNLLVTKVGNASQGSFSPFSPGGWSNYFDGTGDYLSISSSTAFNFGTGNFTIQGWVYMLSYTTGPALFGTTNGATTGYYVNLGGDINSLRVTSNASGSWTDNITVSAGNGVPLNTWTHIALVRNGSSLILYKNGVNVANTNSAASWNFSSPNNAGYIGRVSNGVSTQELNGYISNLKVSNVAETISVPTSQLTSDGNTRLLTCQSNRFIDNSTNNFAVTINGDAAVVNFSPFKPTANYSRTTHGGSVYFDGSGDSVDLTLADSNIAIVGARVGTTQFVWTIEAWVYPLSNIFTIIQRASNSVGDLEWYWYQDSTNGLMWHHRQYGTNDRLVYANIVLKQKQWHHIVQQKEDNSTWVFYVNGVKCNTTYGAGGSPNAYGDVNLVNANLTKIGASTTGPAGAFYMSDFMFTRNIRYSGNNITLPTSPTTANSYTSLLLNYNNAGIVDTTSRNVLETVGDAKIVTSTRKYGTGSMYFDGTGDYLASYTDLTKLNCTFRTGDFTIEAWLNFATVGTNLGIADTATNTTGGSNVQWYMFRRSTNVIGFGIHGADPIISSTTNTAASTWYHLAVTRSGTSVRMFINGVLESSTTNSTDLVAASLQLGLVATPYSMHGYIDDFRITKGVARYTANFTPPTGTFLVR